MTLTVQDQPFQWGYRPGAYFVGMLLEVKHPERIGPAVLYTVVAVEDRCDEHGWRNIELERRA